MAHNNQVVVQEATKRPQTATGTLYISIDKEFLKKHNIDPESGDGVPEEIVTRHHIGGDLDGSVVIDLTKHE